MRHYHCALLVALATPVGAQLPSASSAALAGGDAFVARARGFNAVAWNPAGLGMADNPRFSMTLASVQGSVGLGPVGLSEFKKYEGDTVPHAVREQWLQDIEKSGGLFGGAVGGITELALSTGPLAFQLGTQAGLVSNLGPGAAELIFFGNAGRTGEPRTISGAGSEAIAMATTTLGASYGRALSTGNRRIAAGLTVKYTMGHTLAYAADDETEVSGSPLGGQVSFPMFQTRMKKLNNGNGVGVDVGVSVATGAWRWGAAVQNVMNTFSWDASSFEVRPNWLDVETLQSDFRKHELTEYPEAAKLIEDLRYKPVLTGGMAYEAASWTGALDIRRRTDEKGLEFGSMTQVGAGIEWRGLGVIPLMLGTSWSKDALALSGGLSLRLAGLSATLGGGISRSNGRSDPLLGFTLSSGTR